MWSAAWLLRGMVTQHPESHSDLRWASDGRLLEQAQDLRLKELRVIFAGPASDLEPADESLLAGCTQCERVTLCFQDPARRLSTSPEGVEIVYERFPVATGHP